MIRRFAAAAALALGLALAAPAAAMAATTYPGPPATGTISVQGTSSAVTSVGAGAGQSSGQALTPNPATVVAGSTTVLTGSGFDAAEQVDIYGTQGTLALRASSGAFVQAPAGHKITRVTANAKGGFQLTVTLTDPGVVFFTAVGSEAGHTASTSVKVVSNIEVQGANNQVGGMPNTGINRTMLVLGVAGGALALVIGAGLVWLATTRRSTKHAN